MMDANNVLAKFGLVALFSLALTGCATNSIHLPDWFTLTQEQTPETQAKELPQKSQQELDNGLMYRPEPVAAENQQEGIVVFQTPNELYSPSFTHKGLADYAEQLAMQLVDNARGLTSQSLVGVTSFVNFDSTLQNADVLGNQLAELFIGEIQQFGVSVVDFKTTNTILVQPSGDYIFSRDTYELADEMGMDYVLSGTLIRNEKGVRINARIIALDNRRVMSTASVIVPHFVVEELSPRFISISP